MSVTNHEKESSGASELNGGRVNCILGVCCDSITARQKALAADVERDMKCSPAEAKKYAGYMLDRFDLAPKGSLGGLYQEIAKLAREGYVKAE